MEYLSLVVAIVGSAVAIVAVIIALFFWVRSEANNDRRAADNENKQLRRDLIDVMRAIDQEIRDFHGRLCSIEEKRAK